MDNTEKQPNHFDQQSKNWNAKGAAHFEALGCPPVNPYVRAGIKPNLSKRKKAIWKKFAGYLGI